MIAFEISVNGQVLRTVSVGELGMMTVDVTSARLPAKDGSVEEWMKVIPRGLENADRDSCRWPECDLKVGDVVTVRIIDSDSPGDPPSSRMTEKELGKLTEKVLWKRTKRKR